MRKIYILWAKFLYWNSLGFDMSEMPFAGHKERERRAKLRKRVGEYEYQCIFPDRKTTVIMPNMKDIPLFSLEEIHKAQDECK